MWLVIVITREGTLELVEMTSIQDAAMSRYKSELRSSKRHADVFVRDPSNRIIPELKSKRTLWRALFPSRNDSDSAQPHLSGQVEAR